MGSEAVSWRDHKRAELDHLDLRESKLRKVRLNDAELRAIDLTGADIRGLALIGARIRNADLGDLDITADVWNVTINGVEVAPLIEAELDRRDPDRIKMRPADADGFRTAWDLIEQRWEATVEEARHLDPDRLHASVDDEWSFIETLRHLVFATDAWIRGVLLGDPSPWHPLSLPFDEMNPTPGVPCDRAVRPSLDEVLELRRDRMATMRRVLDGLTDDRLAAHTEPVEGLGFPGTESFPVDEVLRTILNEEWAHRRYAERDLAVLRSS
jgi:hypothetical protein